MKREKLFLSVVASMLILTQSQAGLFSMTKPDVEVAENSVIEERITKYTDALENLNEMTEVYGGSTINVAVVPVENKTAAIGKLPNDVTIMVKSALNEIGGKVRSYTYNDQTLTSVEKLIVIEGAITEFDTTNTSKSGWNVGIKAGKGRGEADGDASADADDSISNMTIDFNMIDAATGAYIPKVHTSNSIKIIKKSASNDFGFSILGSGFGLNSSVSKEQGVHSAIRLLVDLSMVELIGKYKEYPYWVAVSGGKVDQRLLRRMKQNFERLSPEDKSVQVSYLLSLLDPSLGGGTTVFDGKMQQALVNYKNKYGIMPIDTSLNSDIYLHLLENVPKLKGQMQLKSTLNNQYDKML
ncbi:MAG: hypothetical protein FNT15_01400 [Sulfurovum sp.]|nr:MAG: hypothetical protein FNT15_01400 [Sulfurovum sp.]